MKNLNWLTKNLAQAGTLMLSLMLLSQGFLFSANHTVMAQKRSSSRSADTKAQPQRRVDAPEISQGALSDLERQNNPKATSRSAQISADETGKRGGRGAAPDAPALGTNTFDAINFNENANLNGFFQIPPDPSGAAGAAHVVNVTNSAIEWYTKAGVRQNRQTLSSFFAGATNPPQTLTFDPKVVYDHYASRFVVTTMERIEASGMIPNQSRVYVAISKTSDPNGGWWFQTLNTEEPINGRQTWADFPGLAFDVDAVYYTHNNFAHNNQTQAGVFQGQRLWIIPKLPLYNGGQSVLNQLDPSAQANARAAQGFGDGALSTTMQPTIMFDDVSSELGTYLVAYSGINDFVGGSDANLYVQVITIANPLGVGGPPTCTGHFSQWGTILLNDNLFSGLPGAPQNLTTRRIATNDRRVSQNAVFRNGLLHFAAPVLEPASAGADANQVSAHWFIINPLTISTNLTDPPPQDQGDIGGEDVAAGTYTFFPAVAVDAAGDLAISVAASAPSIFAGSYYTGRLVSDPPGTTQPLSTLRAGQDRYIRDFTTSMTVTSRWGDYTSVSIDPSNNSTFWVFNEHALPRGTVLGGLPEEDGRWGNAWGNYSLTSPSTPPTTLPLIISEFRNRGPNGENDEFIEIYNNSDVEQRVVAIDGSGGWAVVAQDGVARCVVPNGTLIAPRGHYLCAAPAFSLSAYAAPNIYYFTADIGDTQGIALFNNATPASFTLANRIDAFGYSSSPALYREGAGFPIIMTFNVNQSFYRDLSGAGGTPKDTGDNSADFIAVNANPEVFDYGVVLGAPGPENLTSPIQRNALLPLTLFDPGAGATSVPNQERSSVIVTNGAQGTLTIRRKITNNTGANVTRIRFRIVDITTRGTPSSATPGKPAPCTAPPCADLRALTSSDEAAVATSLGPMSTRGVVLETPPAQPNGGAYNSSLLLNGVTLATPLAPGASVNVNFRLGVQVDGSYRFFLNVEALP